MSTTSAIALSLPRADLGLETDSVRRTNAQIRRLLEDRYAVVDATSADLVVAGALTEEPVEGPPRMVFGHGAYADPGHWLKTIPLLRRCDVLVTTSRSDARILATHGGTDFCDRVHLPLFTDLAMFYPRPDSAIDRHELGLPEDEPVLLTVSSLAPGKNVQSAMLVLRALHDRRCSAHLAIVGEGAAATKAYLTDLTRRLSLESFVHFLGALGPAQLNKAYSAADLVLHLSLMWKENFGLVPVEAQATGTPVLASAWGGLADNVRHGKTGYLARTYLVGNERRVEWPSLVQRCLRLLENSSSRMTMGQRAIEWVESRYTPQAFAERLYAAVDWILSRTVLDTAKVTLSEQGRSMVASFAHAAARAEQPRRSGDIVRSRRGIVDGEHVQRSIHRCMATRDGPPRPTRQSLVARAVDLRITTSGCEILDPLWTRHLRLSVTEMAVLRSVEGLSSLNELVERSPSDPTVTRAAVQGLIDKGLLCSAPLAS